MKVYEFQKQEVAHCKAYVPKISDAHNRDLSGSYVRLEDVKDIAKKAHNSGRFSWDTFEEWFEKLNKDKLKD